MKKALVWGIIVLTLLAMATTLASAQACMISRGIPYKLFPDTDCDGIIDIEDNCPVIPNPMQRDAERNGLGDSCDIYIESIRTSPSDFVYNGRAFETLVTIHNNRDYNIRNMKVRLIAPELGIESVQYIDNLEVCGSKTIEFFLRAPMCSPALEQRLIVEISFMNLWGDTEVIPGITTIRIMPDQYCQMVMENNQTIGDTIIDVMEIQDVYKGQEAVFPIRISNREESDKEYIFTVTGIDSSWGYYRLEPGSLIIVPDQTERIMDLYVGAYNGMDVRPGERVFVVSVQSGEEVQRFLLIANVKESGAPDNSFYLWFSVKNIIIGILIALIVIAIIIAIAKYTASVKQESDVQYY
ncbi:hypothetical protein JXB28_03530 [Candidatus Woesearchaeota archaeon]|nr:hypothetical protein [Candidatus Woesearchaeota archaeon]